MNKPSLAALRMRTNPFYALSPILFKTVSVNKLQAESGPYEYAPAGRLVTPEIMHYPVMPHMQHLQKPVHEQSAASVRILGNLIYSAQSMLKEKNMLLTADHRFIEESSSTMRMARHFDWRVCRRKVSASVKGIVFPFRGVSSNYYHTLLDNVPRLMALDHPEISSLSGIKIIIPEGITVVERFFLDRVLGTNVDVRIIKAGRAYRLEHCLFPEFATTQYSGFISPAIRQFFNTKILPKRQRVPDRLIYISRSKASVRRLLNEEDVITCVQNAGFEIYHLEEMSMQDQVELFFDARAVIALHGAGLTNLAFSAKVNTLEIFPYRYVKPSYYHLTKSVGGNYSYIAGVSEQINVDMRVDLGELEKKLEEMRLA